MKWVPYETVIDVPTGLTNCSVPDFAKLFDFLLQQAMVKALDNDTHEGNMLQQVKAILSIAVDACHSLCKQASVILSSNQVDILMLSARTARMKCVQ